MAEALRDKLDSIPKVDETSIPVVLSEEPSDLARVYYGLLSFAAFIAVCYLWRKIIDIGTEKNLSLRGELLTSILIYLNVYCFFWIPILLIGATDGELETSSVSPGFKGQIVNLHCSFQDLLARTFCVTVVVSSAIYMRYCGLKDSDDCCCCRPDIFTWGVFIPAILVEVSRVVFEQEEWLMPTLSITQFLHSAKFSVKSTPPFCVLLIDSAWLRQVMVEWFISVALVMTVVYCMAPCIFHKENSKDGKTCFGSESAYSSDSETEDFMELQMDSLLESESTTSKDSKFPLSVSSNSKELKPVCQLIEAGSYAKGSGFLEAIVSIGVLWASIVRPFLAISLYISHTEIYSNQLDMPTHILLIIAVTVLTAELILNPSKEEEEEEEEEEKNRESADKKEANSLTENDDDIIWIIDEDKGTAYTIKGKENEDDVDPIWLHTDTDKQNDDGQEEESSSLKQVSAEEESKGSPQ